VAANDPSVKTKSLVAVNALFFMGGLIGIVLALRAGPQVTSTKLSREDVSQIQRLVREDMRREMFSTMPGLHWKKFKNSFSSICRWTTGRVCQIDYVATDRVQVLVKSASGDFSYLVLRRRVLSSFDWYVFGRVAGRMLPPFDEGGDALRYFYEFPYRKRGVVRGAGGPGSNRWSLGTAPVETAVTHRSREFSDSEFSASLSNRTNLKLGP